MNFPQRTTDRITELFTKLGMRYLADDTCVGAGPLVDFNVHMTEIKTMSEETWDHMVSEMIAEKNRRASGAVPNQNAGLKTFEEMRDEDIQEWLAAQEAATAAKDVIARELELRKMIRDRYFDKATEGVNKLQLGNGYFLKLSHKIDRKLDVAVLPSITEELREIGVDIDFVVERKPTLRLANYRELTAEQMQVFDKALTIKPASPELELVEPKKKKGE